MIEIIPEIAVRNALESLKQRLLQAAKEEISKIIFFGSKRTGSFRIDSDIDVFIIVRRKNHQLRDVIYAISDSIERDILSYRIPLSLHIFQEEEYRRYIEKGSPFLVELENKGEVLYERIS